MPQKWIGVLLFMTLSTASAWAQPPLPQQQIQVFEAPPQALPPEEALQKARVNGKYAMLLQQIEVRQDFRVYGGFRDSGFWTGTEWAGYKDLPLGHWVYVYPYWYIWRDLTATPGNKRGWGPEQATGEPDTLQAGDVRTAWASSTPDGRDEWLLLEYNEPIAVRTIKIYESYNTGALNKISLFSLDGKEVTVFEGQDPTPPGTGSGVSTIRGKANFKSNRIKIYLDSDAVQGYNEIDAVGLVDEAGKTHWAASAEASTTYARTDAVGNVIDVKPLQPVLDGLIPRVDADDLKLTQARLAQLEAEVAKLKAMIEELKQQLRPNHPNPRER